MPEELKLSIVICTYNRINLLIKCLEALFEQTLPKKFYEIIVVDNNSTDDTKEAISNILIDNNNFNYFLEQRQGLSYARNRGIKEAKGVFIAYIDDDAIAVPEWAEKIIYSFENVVPTPLSVGGYCEPWYDTKPPAWFDNNFEIRTWGENGRFLNSNEAKFGFGGLNMAFQTQVLKKFNGFNPELGVTGYKTRMGEEADLYFRISKDNFTISENIFWYEPGMKIKHWTGVRNFKIKYRTERSYMAGEAIAIIEGKGIFSISVLKTVGYFFMQFYNLLFEILKFSSPMKTEWVKFLQKINFALGYVFQCLKQ